MTNEQVERLLRRYRANWNLDAEVEEELRGMLRGLHEETANMALDEIANDRRARNKLSKWEGPRPNEFWVVAEKHMPQRKKAVSPPCCAECWYSGWRVVIMCGPNWQAHPCSVIYPAMLQPEDPLARWYWTHRIPCRCLGGEHRRTAYTGFTETQANRLYSASMSLARGQWFCEEMQMYSDHFHFGAPLREKGPTDPDIVQMVEKAVAAMQSGSTGELDGRTTEQPTPVEEAWQ